MNLYEIREKLSESKIALFTINGISKIIQLKKPVVSVYINRMIKKRLLYRIEKGKVSLTDDPFITSSQLIFPSYISLVSALYLHSIMEQIIDKIYLITTKQRKRTKIFGVEVIFIKTSPKMMFGYKKIEKEQSFIMLADLEKTIIDCLCFQKYCRLSYILKALKAANTDKLKEYAYILKKEVINRRLGYLLDLLGKRHSLKRKTSTTYKLNPIIKKKGKFNAKWYLYINEEL